MSPKLARKTSHNPRLPGFSKVSHPPWLKDITRIKAEMRSHIWPATAEDGIEEVLALSDQAWRQLRAQLKLHYPKATRCQLEQLAYQQVGQWEEARNRLIGSRTQRMLRHA
ncbi:MAG: hypothetical protein D6690_09840 [Nitrospirae bacterium]|nr:MAG: hypothetical protein D6690_09840 [Nitrospirota bacterium]